MSVIPTMTALVIRGLSTPAVAKRREQRWAAVLPSRKSVKETPGASVTCLSKTKWDLGKLEGCLLNSKKPSDLLRLFRQKLWKCLHKQATDFLGHSWSKGI